MSGVKLYLVRHGKTMFNTIGRAQGWSDTPLTAEGERGIHELGIGLRESGLTFERAYSSDSGRTIQTMGIILEELGLTGQIPYRMDKRIREGLVEVDTAGWAEGWEKLSGRIWEGFEAIAKEMEANGGGNALVVSHGMTIGTIVYLINGMHPHGLDNGSVTILEYQDDQFSVEIVGDRSYREIGRAKLEEQASSEQ